MSSFMSKRHRKTRRGAEKVRKDWPDIRVTLDEEKATEHLLLCNYGLMTGHSQTSLAERFLPYGNLRRIVLLPGKAYSFLSYTCREDALKAFRRESTDVEDVDDDTDTKSAPVYLCFVDAPPSSDALSESNPFLDASAENWPEGLRLVKDFVSPEEESQILTDLRWPEEQEDASALKHRQVQHFGHAFVYGQNTIDKDHPLLDRPLPESWQPFLRRAVDRGHLRSMPDQCTVNRYAPGQGIPAHVDTHSCCDDVIVSLSLGSDVVMDFARGDAKRVPVILPKRSLLVMSAEARYAYTHGITPRVSDIVPADDADSTGAAGLTLQPRSVRVSLTFRKILRTPCSCAYPAHCDSQKDDQKQNDARLRLDDSLARDLERVHVHAVYEEIADHFSETRHKPWPRVIEFLDSLDEEALLLDVGCGNGKYLGRHSKQMQIACDYSHNLASICQERGFPAVRSSCLSLPLRSNMADGVICIAVIHHLSTAERRRRSIEEMRRALKPGGRCLIYAWAHEQKRGERPSTYLKSGGGGGDGGGGPTSSAQFRAASDNDEKNDKKAKCDTAAPLVLPVHTNRTDFKHADLLVPWKKKKSDDNPKEQMFHRFYHVFKEHELEELVSSVDGVRVVECYYDQGNWCVIFEKSGPGFVRV